MSQPATPVFPAPAGGGAQPVPRVEAVELIRISMPLVAPFRTSFGV